VTERANLPFCSARCKAVDLGRWLAGDYRIPGRPAELDPGDGSGAMREQGEA
jgi:endogenous inhibitor of DNA gyrase (YacG/DUF329 family)